MTTQLAFQNLCNSIMYALNRCSVKHSSNTTLCQEVLDVQINNEVLQPLLNGNPFARGSLTGAGAAPAVNINTTFAGVGSTSTTANDANPTNNAFKITLTYTGLTLTGNRLFSVVFTTAYVKKPKVLWTIEVSGAITGGV